MGKLHDIKTHVQKVYSIHKHRIPHLPVIPTIPATSIAATRLSFHGLTDDAKTPLQSLQFHGWDMYLSQPIYLQDSQNSQAWSVFLDLRNLHAGVVFPVILSNKPGTDPFGKKGCTILLRNGVTGTAAKKRANQPIIWLYHGMPLNDRNLSVCVTITSDQFTIAYKSDDTNSYLVHGDSPISKLGRAQIGDVEGIPFYVNILFKRKSGDDGFINILDQDETGYIHADATTISRDPHVNPPTSIRLVLGREQTSRLQGIIDFYGLRMDFRIQSNILVPAYQTLASHKDLPLEQYAEVVHDNYAPLRDKPVEVNITAIIADGDCVALLTDTPRGSETGLEIPSFSKDRVPHIRMRLRDQSITAEYSNALAERVTEDHERDWIHVGDSYIQLPQPVKVLCHLEFEF